ncbi:hypothetical protein [Janthinobacterium sp. NKUCC08_JDC]|uniref:hypothetical protein n=1 Tax=Janthinobacterium sp. NKUCC08_JDC TaxID=2842122 RepID=UPI001C5B8638|nr:hypothetical protein [Janthinobacterium sp. NKUCC08_JDC]MBW3497006.1 hypothetical protein [Janthinobacterium sp. NKUCC08_JDC]
MGDFFYYGQKDTIQRLNELAGRGAVVASYAPAVGRSPVGGPNGYMDPAWLDPRIPITTYKPISVGAANKYGYSYLADGAGTTRWLKIASMNAEGVSTAANLYIRGVFNNSWAASTSTPFSIFMGVRGGFYVDWHVEGAILGQSRIMVCRRVDGVHDVYAFFDAGTYASISFDMTGYETTTYAVPVETTAAPAGTMVFDSATSPGNPIHIAPRWKGVPGRLAGSRSTAFSDAIFTGENGGLAAGGYSFLAGGTILGTTAPLEVLRLGVSGVSGSAFHGHFGFMTAPGNVLYTQGYHLTLRAYDTGSGNWTGTLIDVKGDGLVTVPGTVEVGVVNTEVQGVQKIAVHNCIKAYVVSGSYGNAAGAALNVATHTVTGSSIRTGGTVNTSGNDYAEYIFKGPICGIVSPGQIIGITPDNQITDQWADAVMFSIKSTAPSFVGGDSWANDVGPRPSAQAGPAPAQPLRREDVVAQQLVPGTNPPEYEDVVTEPGDNDEAWAEKQAVFAAALAAYELAVLQDAEAMAAFDAALEAERQKVDRIAIAGRVPVNVLGAQPGDYIVPVQDGAGINGIAMHEDDLSMKQYLHAVGRVISIEPDGRAYVMVKAV